MTLSHIAPYVDVSRQKIRKRITAEMKEAKIKATQEQINDMAEKEVNKEIESGCQTIQYQLITLHSTNGQAPFITLFMYLDEVPEGQTRDDLAKIIETMLQQRIDGIPDGKGHTLTVAFPKLIYCLDEDNINTNSKYYYLTKLAAKCSAKRLVPDYISAKKMKELKGDVFPSMGCVSEHEVIDYMIDTRRYVESFGKAWRRLQSIFGSELQPNGYDFIINPKGTVIYDNNLKSYVPMKHMIKNHAKTWVELSLSNGRILECTPDHPLETIDGTKLVKDLTTNDVIFTPGLQERPYGTNMSLSAAWCTGIMMMNGEYKTHAEVTLPEKRAQLTMKFRKAFRSTFGATMSVNTSGISIRGNHYIDMRARETDGASLERIKAELHEMFGAYKHVNRQIPSNIFHATAKARAAFLQGIIDARGEMHISRDTLRIDVENVSKTAAIQEVLLAQSIGIAAAIKHKQLVTPMATKDRYVVSFTADQLSHYAYSQQDLHQLSKDTIVQFILAINATQRKKPVCSKAIIQDIRVYTKDNSFSYDVTTTSGHFMVSGIYSHNCRSFLTPDRFTDNGKYNMANAKTDEQNKRKYYGRFNAGVVTLNLVDIACSSGKNMNKFWKIFDERLELCHKALQIRYKTLLGTPSDVAPLIWQDGGYARLKHGELIDKLLFDGYATISLGYAGLAECVMYMLDKSHINSKEGMEFGLAVMQHLDDACDKWKAEENIDYSVYGSPIESTTYKFAKCLQRRFGIIKNVTDHNYITNSYHTCVREKINAFDKLTNESKFQKLSPGGAISYVEVPNMQNNIEAVLAVLKHIYNTIMYAELNTKNDTCMKCGYSGEIQIEKKGNKLVWQCPNCGNEDQDTMQVVRRTCGQNYIGHISKR